MRNLRVVVCGCLGAWVLCASVAEAGGNDALIRLLIKKGLITEQELETAQSELASITPSTTAPAAAPTPTYPALKLSGRWALGFLQSGASGSDPNGAFRIPDAKLRFDVSPDATNTLVTRLNLNNASFNNLDYVYLESKDFLPWLKEQPLSLTTRIGRVKMDFGEETWSNNSIEGALSSTSAANVSGHDEGLQAILTWKTMGSPRLSLGIFNGNTNGTTFTDNTGPKAYSAKVALTPISSFYLSSSFFDSRALKTSASEFSIGGVTTAPSGAANWSRRAWELDGRYDLKKGKAALNPPVFTDSRAYLRGAYGLFGDDAKGGTDRNGDYGFLEAMWNIHPKWYTAARWSILDFDQEASATLGGITTVKRLQRYQLGGGFRWSERTLLKGEWLWDRESGRTSADDAPNNQLSLLAASQF
ncbi:MAG: hypothetical protein HYT88_01255 [Candidatus Omnitrophica bacterium]|nr:hypothetical protein [Candidatus Omnitrophota bacterium]MBI2173876.1 hypothetical protein [Candidatus Omnitrophota bacterium]MBI3009835.1 hypothetical protein [Candidatus Omnitrophota bacterium]